MDQRYTEYSQRNECKDDYRITNKRVGKGGQGSVYIACCNEPEKKSSEDCTHLVKIISIKNLATEHKFKTEVVLQSLAADEGLAPKIFKTWIAGTGKNKTGFFVMEKMDRSLSEILNECKYDQEKTEKVFRKVETLVQNLHNLSIFHGDLHLDNIMTHKGKYKVIDFGDAVLKEDITSSDLKNEYTRIVGSEYDLFEKIAQSKIKSFGFMGKKGEIKKDIKNIINNKKINQNMPKSKSIKRRVKSVKRSLKSTKRSLKRNSLKRSKKSVKRNTKRSIKYSYRMGLGLTLDENVDEYVPPSPINNYQNFLSPKASSSKFKLDLSSPKSGSSKFKLNLNSPKSESSKFKLDLNSPKSPKASSSKFKLDLSSPKSPKSESSKFKLDLSSPKSPKSESSKFKLDLSSPTISMSVVKSPKSDNIENFDKLSQLPMDKIEELLKNDRSGKIFHMIESLYQKNKKRVDSVIKAIPKGNRADCSIYENVEEKCTQLGTGRDGTSYICREVDKVVKKYSGKLLNQRYIYRMAVIISKINEFLQENPKYGINFTSPELINCNEDGEYDYSKFYEIQQNAGENVKSYLERYSDNIEKLRKKVFKLMRDFGHIIVTLAQNNLFHNDTHIGNIFVKDDNAVFIDYGRMTYDYPLDKASFLSDHKNKYIYDLVLLFTWLDLIYKEIVIKKTYEEKGVALIDKSIDKWINRYALTISSIDPSYKGGKFVKGDMVRSGVQERDTFEVLPYAFINIEETIEPINLVKA